jgi:hypothetical protein
MGLDLWRRHNINLSPAAQLPATRHHINQLPGAIFAELITEN